MMSDNNIEGAIRRAVRQETPDMLGELMAELGFESEGADARTPETEPPAAHLAPLEAATSPAANDAMAAPDHMDRPRIARAHRWLFAALPAAAAVLLALIAFAPMLAGGQAAAVVGLDVNPSIELSVNSNERVINASALNEDAAMVLSDLDLQGTDLNTACHAVVGSMLVKGYLTPDSNSILVSVQSADVQKGRALEQEVSKNLNAFLENSAVSAAILGQYIEGSEDLERFAEQNNISLGKAWLIKKLLASGSSKMNEKSLLELSTQDLILLAQKRKVKSETSIGSSSASKYISAGKALEVALKAAGVSKSDAQRVEVELDCEDGVVVYEVEFDVAGAEHEFAIDAKTGAVLSAKAENTGGAKTAAKSAAPKVHADDDDDDDDDDDGDDGDDGDDDDDDDDDDD